MFPTDHEFRRYAIAQATAKRIATRIAQQIEPGMTEADAYSLAEQSFQREGIRRHWHMPVIGLGGNAQALFARGACPCSNYAWAALRRIGQCRDDRHRAGS